MAHKSFNTWIREQYGPDNVLAFRRFWVREAHAKFGKGSYTFSKIIAAVKAAGGDEVVQAQALKTYELYAERVLGKPGFKPENEDSPNFISQFDQLLQKKEEEAKNEMKKMVWWTVLTTFGVILFMLGCCSITVIDPGETGVKVLFGDISEECLQQGFHLVNPFASVNHISWKNINTTVQRTAEEQEAAITQDLQTVGFRLDIGWAVEPTKAWLLVMHIGDDQEVWADQIISPCMLLACKTVLSRYPLIQIVRERDKVRREIGAELSSLINERLTNKTSDLAGSVDILQVALSNLDYSSEYEDIINQTEIARRAVERETQILERVQIEAQQQVAQASAKRDAMIQEAQGEAESIRIRLRAELERLLRLRQAGLDINLVKYLEAWDGALPRLMGGGELGAIIPAAADMDNLTENDIQLILNSLAPLSSTEREQEQETNSGE